MTVKIADGLEHAILSFETPSIDEKAVTALASFTVLLLDYCLTLPDEVDLVWSRTWTRVGTLLFMLNRYLPFVDTVLFLNATVKVLDLEDCVMQERIVSWLVGLGIVLSETVLLFRTMALWSGYKAVTISLLIFSLATSVAGLVFSRVWFKSIEWYPTSQTLVPGCRIARSNGMIVYSFAIILAFETVIVCLTALRARYHLCGGSSAWMLRLYRQGFIFYVYLLAIGILNVTWPFVLESSKPYNLTLFNGPHRVLHSIMCNRVFFIIFRRRPVGKLPQISHPKHVSTFNQGRIDRAEVHTASGGILNSIITAPSEWLGEDSDVYMEEEVVVEEEAIEEA